MSVGLLEHRPEPERVHARRDPVQDRLVLVDDANDAIPGPLGVEDAGQKALRHSSLGLSGHAVSSPMRSPREPACVLIACIGRVRSEPA